MLTKTELRKLIRAHNILSKITIPKGASLDDMVKLVEKAGYKVNHDQKKIMPGVKRGKQITLKEAEEITKPKPKTALQKQKAMEKKQEKEMEKKKKEREIRKQAVLSEKKRTTEKKIGMKEIELKDIKRGDRITGNKTKRGNERIAGRVLDSDNKGVVIKNKNDEIFVYPPFGLVSKRRYPSRG